MAGIFLLAGLSPIHGATKPPLKWSKPFINVSSIRPSAIVQDRLYCQADGVSAVLTVWTNGAVLGTIANESGFCVDDDRTLYVRRGSRITALDQANTVLWGYNLWRGAANLGPILGPRNHTILSLSYESGDLERKLYLVKLSTTGEPSLYNQIGYMASAASTNNLAFSQIAVSPNGRVYVVVDSVLNAFDSDGNLLWKYTLYELENSTPAIDAAGVIYAQARQAVVAIDANGRTKWRNDVSPFASFVNYDSPPVFARDRLFVSWLDRVYCFDRSGSVLWQKSIPNATQPRVAADGTVYLVAGGALRCLDSLGVEQWRFSPVTSPAVLGDDGAIYVANDNVLYVLDGAAKGPHPWPMDGGGAGRRNVGAGVGIPSATITNGQFILRIAAEGVTNGILESSGDLRIWNAVTNYDVTFERAFLDRDASNSASRFFRLREGR
ncbi:MAG TPA: PQQ-binding-like beta-propeller repeat protein [Verrucomicrobiae bacterium]|nr:PQQ-binding-like beta-propeller repeat protein [Verrucomicrobiae bacterium]